MTLVMAAFAILVSIMFVGTIIYSLQEAGRESRDLAESRSRYRVF